MSSGERSGPGDERTDMPAARTSSADDGATAALLTPARRRRRAGGVVLWTIPVVVAIVCALVYLGGGDRVSTDNAYVKADVAPISPAVAGIVREIGVAENEVVVAGQLLFALDPEPFEVEVARAEANIARVEVELAAMRASYRRMQAEIALKKTNRRHREREEVRQAELAAKGFISSARLDDARVGAEQSSQEVSTLVHELARIAAGLGGGPDAPIERHPAWRAARAELERARLDRARSEVRAPLAGVASRPPKPGQYLAAGSLAMVVVARDDLWVEANFNEVDMTHVRPGQAVRVRVDTYPDLAWSGVVDSISPATGAQFAVLPAQNATGNWVKVSQRVPVRIRLDPRPRRRQGLGEVEAGDSPGAPTLRAGLSASVSVETGHVRRLFGFSLPGR